MRHSDIIDKYNEAQKYFKKGNFKKAKRLFEHILLELDASDTDSMVDMNLFNSSEEYLEMITEKQLPTFRVQIVLGMILLISILLIFLVKLLT